MLLAERRIQFVLNQAMMAMTKSSTLYSEMIPICLVAQIR